MRILFLTKRYYMRRDVLMDRYGRFWHIPLALAERCHDVRCVCTAYYDNPEPKETTVHLRDDTTGSLQWESARVQPYSPLAWRSHYRFLISQMNEWQPDCIIAASDAFHIILGAYLARKTGVPLIADFYDNFESYGATKLPGVRFTLRRATRSASTVTCVSEPLRQKLIGEYRLSCPVMVLENGVEPGFFEHTEKSLARAELKLPQHAKLIGAMGAIDTSRGIDALFDAFESLASEDENVHLVLAGTSNKPLPKHRNVHYLGDLPHRRIPVFLRALDVGVICVKDDAFGRYCFPQKAAEMAAAGLPMVFPAIGVMGTTLADKWGERVIPKSVGALADGIRRQLNTPRSPKWQPGTWRELSKGLSEKLSDVVRS